MLMILILIPKNVFASTTLWPNAFKIQAYRNGRIIRESASGEFSSLAGVSLVDQYAVAAVSDGWTVANSNLSIVSFSIQTGEQRYVSIKNVSLSATGDSQCFYNLSNKIVDQNLFVTDVVAYCPYELGDFTRNTNNWFFYVQTDAHYPTNFSIGSLTYINDTAGITERLKSIDEYNISNNAILNDINHKLDNLGFDSTSIIENQNKNQQQTNERLDKTNEQLGDLNNNITNSDINDASSSADSFFSGFESNDFGLTSIITSPLNLIKSITSSTCTPLGFPAPFVNKQITLPCMRGIYQEFFGSFLAIYQTITFGIVAYWVCVNTFATVKGFKDPDSDRIEVLDL